MKRLKKYVLIRYQTNFNKIKSEMFKKIYSTVLTITISFLSLKFFILI